MNEYRVDKREHPVVLFLADGLVLEGVVFLSAYASTHTGAQTMLDLLREDGTFLPFRSHDGNFTLVSKNAITHLRYPSQGATDAAFGDQVKVRLTFFGGETLQGTIVIDMPQGKNRLIDYVNASPGFFNLQGDEACYIANGNLVREISLD